MLGDHQIMRLGPIRRLQLAGKSADHPFRHRARSPLVAAEDGRQRRLDVRDFHSCPIVGKQADPAPARVAEQIGRTKGERSSGSEQFSTPLPGFLDHLALILRRVHVEFGPDVVERLREVSVAGGACVRSQG